MPRYPLPKKPAIKSTNVADEFIEPATDAEVEGGIEAWHGTPKPFGPGVRIIDKETGVTVVRKPDDPMTELLNKRHPGRYEVVQESELGLFDDAKIGTGEGAQAFGYGHYAAGGVGTARNYRSSLLGQHGVDDISTIDGKPLSSHYMKLMDAEAKGDPTAWEKLNILEELEFRGDTLAVRESIDSMELSQSTKDWFFKEVEPKFDRPGALYKLNINTSDDKLLDYSADISAQPKAVQNVVSKYREQFDEYVDDMGGVDLEDQMGVDLYDTIRVMLEQDRLPYESGSRIERALENGQSDKAASIFLQEHGVDGIKYLDGVSRRKGEGQHNYVVFNPSLISIAKKYNISLPMAAKIFATATGSYGVMAVNAPEVEAAAWSEGLEMILRKQFAGEKLTAAEKSHLTRYEKALENRAVNYREGLRRDGETIEVVTPQPETKIITPEDMQGNVLVPVVGDRSRTGVEVHQVNGVKLSRPVYIPGGPGYAQQNAERGVAWASNLSAASGKQSNFDKAAQDTGLDVTGVYTALAPTGSHYMNAVSEIMLAQIPNLKIPARDINEFNKLIKKQFPEFVGVKHPDVFDQIMNQGKFSGKDETRAGNMRKHIIDRMKLADWREKGFPVYEDVINVVNEAGLRDAEYGATGRTMFDAVPGAKVVPSDTNINYSHDILGQYKGTLEILVPPSVMFPKTFDMLSKEINVAGKPFNYQQQVGSLAKRHLWEIADQQWLDGMMLFKENMHNPAKIKQLAKAGLLPASLLASGVYAEEVPDDADPNTKAAIQEAIAVRERVKSQGTGGPIGYGDDGEPIYPPLQVPNRKIVVPAGVQIEETPRTEDYPQESPDQIQARVLESYSESQEISDDEYLARFMEDEPTDMGLPEIDPRATGVAGAAADIGKGLIETPVQIAAGFLDATAEMAEFMESIIPLGGETMRIDAEPTTVTSGLVRGVSQFFTGMVGPQKLQAFMNTPKYLRPFISGAFADAFAFDPDDPNLVDALDQWGMGEYVPDILNYLKSDPEDSEAEKRFKKALEGAGIGAGVELVAKGFGVMRNFARTRKALAATTATGAGAGTATMQEAVEESGALAKYADAEGQEYIPFEDMIRDSQVEFETKPREYGMGDSFAPEEAADNINLANLETTEDVDTLIQKVAQADAVDINQARREQMSFEATERLADDLGMTVEDLLNRRRGQAFNAEEALAARKILVASGENLMRLAEKAKNGGDAEVAVFRRAMAIHKAVQNQVSGMTAEAGRALSSFRIMAQSAKEQERLISEAIDAAGGTETIREMARRVSEARTTQEINTTVRNTFAAKTKEAVMEFWINGLLSNLPTHSVNILSNTAVAGLVPIERKIASVMSNGERIPQGESSSMLVGALYGIRDGFVAAGHYIKTGRGSDPGSKIDITSESRRAISAEGLELSGWLGRGADVIGSIVRVPGAALQASDEFFKAIAYRMELHARAHRQATQEGLTGEAFDQRMADIIKNPPPDIKLAAMDARQYRTFTNKLGPANNLLMQARNHSTVARVIVPFFQTPVNVLNYSLERTPLAPLYSKVREDIMAGGAKRDEAMAKIAVGSMIMAVTADMVMRGHITGNGPADRSMQDVLKTTGWQPYSIKVGDTYYAYNRMDPVGMVMGLSADITEIIGQTDNAEADRIAAAAVLSIAQNVLNKSYLIGVSDTVELISGASTDPEGRNKALDSWLKRFAGSIVPAGVAGIERTMNPELSATYTMLDQIKSRIPGYSDELPPRRNIFGEPIVLDGGVGPDFMSPIYVSNNKFDAVADEVAAQQVGVRMPSQVMDGIELDAWQYDKYIQLYAGIENPLTKRTLKEELAETFKRTTYKNGTNGAEGSKAQQIQNVFSAYRQAAKAQMYEEFPELQYERELLNMQERLNKTGR